MPQRPPFSPTQKLLQRSPAEARFVSELARHQDSLGLTDADFADQTGASLFTWRRTRSGDIALGFAILEIGKSLVPPLVYMTAKDSVTERVSKRRKRTRKDKAA